MTQAIIRKGFEVALKAWADAQTPVIPIAWPNVAFSPPTGRYVKADTIPAKTQRLSFDGTGRTWRGLFQVTFVMPINIGSGSAESLCKSLDDAFASFFVQDGVRIYLLSPFCQAGAIPEPDRYSVPCSAEYRADTV